MDYQGQLLLADPAMREGSFRQSAILVADHSETEGTFGVALNRPTGRIVKDYIDTADLPALAHVKVFAGGPVGKDHLTFAAFWKKDGVVHYRTRLLAAAAERHLQQNGAIVHAYVGYSGWSVGQLDEEMEQTAWHLAPLDPWLLREPHNQRLWQEALASLSPYHRILSLAPEHPFEN